MVSINHVSSGRLVGLNGFGSGVYHKSGLFWGLMWWGFARVGFFWPGILLLG